MACGADADFNVLLGRACVVDSTARAGDVGLVDTQDECPLSCLETSGELRRAPALAQGMKSDDALLAAWEETLARKGDAPAIFDTRGEVLADVWGGRRAGARELEAKIESSDGRGLSDRIGNHPDWPSLLLASLRRPARGPAARRVRHAATTRGGPGCLQGVDRRRVGRSTPRVAEIDFGHHGRSPRHPFSQRTAPGRLQPDLRHDGDRPRRSEFRRHSASPIPMASAIWSRRCSFAAFRWS